MKLGTISVCCCCCCGLGFPLPTRVLGPGASSPRICHNSGSCCSLGACLVREVVEKNTLKVCCSGSLACVGLCAISVCCHSSRMGCGSGSTLELADFYGFSVMWQPGGWRDRHKLGLVPLLCSRAGCCPAALRLTQVSGSGFNDILI